MKTLLTGGAASQRLSRLIDLAALACGWWLIGLAAMTCIEMLGRKLFSFSLQGVDEVGSYTYAIVGAIGFAYALNCRSHTRVDFLLGRFQPRTRSVLNLMAIVFLAAAALLCLWRAYAVVAESVSFGSTAATPLATPMWIPQSIWLFGYLMFALSATIAAWHALQLFLRGRTDELNDRFGPQTLEEEIAAETDLPIAPVAPDASRP